MPVQFTTTLPDEDQPVLGNGVEDEVAVDRESAPTNYGDVRLQIRETGQSSWDGAATGYAEQTISYDTLTTTFTGLEDGEEYEVRARTETEHVTGAWTAPVSIVTQFPGVTGLAVDAVGTTTVDLSWTDNADNEDGFELRRRRDYDGSWGPWRLVDTLDPNTESVTDDTVSPERTYQYELEAFTDDASATAGPVETTTDSAGAAQRRLGARETRVEVDHPDVDEPLEPRILDDPVWKPSLNGTPTVEIPVPANDKWLADAFDDAPMRVWLDGDRLPITQLDNRRVKPDRMVLIGGLDLDTRVELDVQEEEAHVTAETVIDETPYAADVDEPDVTVETRTAQEADTEAEWDGNLQSIPADKPLTVTSDGTLRQQQTLFWAEAEGDEVFVQSDSQFFADAAASGGQGEVFRSSVHNLEYDATFAHDPSNGVAVAVRVRAETGGANPAFTVSIDDTEIEPVPAGALTSTNYQFFGGTLSSATTAGEYTAQIETSDYTTDNDGLVVDGVALFNPDYHDRGDFASTVGPNGYLSLGSGNYPDLIRQQTQDTTFAEQVVGGALSSAWNNTGGSQEVAISQDQGATWTVAQNSETVSKNWGTGTPQIRARFGLSSWGSRDTATPTQGYNRQEVDLYDLEADFDSTPLLVDRTFDESADAVLREIADYSNALWEARWDSANDQIVIVWTQPGQRTSDVDPDIVSYEVDKSTENQAKKVVIKGSTTPVSGAQLTANHGTSQELTTQTILTGSEAVRDPDTGTQFERNTDYTMDYGAPASITTLSTGAMTDGDSYEISYQKQPEGEYAVPSFDPSTDDPLVRTIAAATSNRECQQAAIYLANELKDPLITATLTIDRLEAGLSLVDDATFSGLPDSIPPVETQNIEQGPRSVTLQGGTRSPLSELLARRGARLGAAEKRL